MPQRELQKLKHPDAKKWIVRIYYNAFDYDPDEGYYGMSTSENNSSLFTFDDLTGLENLLRMGPDQNKISEIRITRQG